MWKPALLVHCFSVVASVALMPVACSAQQFDGNWSTTLVCPAKGNTDGYTWHFVSVIENNVLHGERGTANEPGYFALDGRIAADGSAKLTGNGIVASRQYARGVFAHKGEDYDYEVRAQFQETKGAGTRNEGMGIVGRPCTFDFVKMQPGESLPKEGTGPGH
jgi:hypothetical protein